MELELRPDEAEYLGTKRCYCGHLDALHNTHCCDFCLVDDGRHHFCSEIAERMHLEEQVRIRGNPAVGRHWLCPECQEALKVEGG